MKRVEADKTQWRVPLGRKTGGRRRVKERINRPLVSLGHCPLFRCLLKQLTGTSRCSVVSLALRLQGVQRTALSIALYLPGWLASAEKF